MSLKGTRKKLLLFFTGVLLFLLILRNLCVHRSFCRIISELEGYELYASAITEYEKLNAVREFVYQNSVFAAGKDVWEDSTFGKDVFALTKRARLVRLFNLRRNMRGGGYCGMFAIQLAMLYQCLGYRAYQLNIDAGGNQHALTAVYFPAIEDWIIQDACFNYTITDCNDPGMKRLLRELQQKDTTRIQFVPGSKVSTLSVSHTPCNECHSYYPLLGVIRVRNGRYLYEIDRTYGHYKDFEYMKRVFSSDGYTDNPASELLYVNHIVRLYGLDDFFQFNARIKDLQELRRIFSLSR